MFRKIFVTSFCLQALVYNILSCDIQDRFRCNINCDGYYICTHGIDEMYNCPQGQHCDMITHNCSFEVSSCGPEGYQFKCSSEGIYPDPYDCTKYYICGPANGRYQYDPEPTEDGTDFRHSCTDGFAYNPGSTLCDFNLTDDVCKYGPVPKCEVLYQTDSLRTNESIYYICTKIGDYGLIPQLFRCDSGYYNSSTCKCNNYNLNLERYSVFPCSVNDTEITTFTSDITEESTDYTTEILSTTSGSTTEGTTSTFPPTEGTTSTFYPTEGTTDSSTGETTTFPPTEGTTSTFYPTEGTTDSSTGETTTFPPTEGTASTFYPTEGTTDSSTRETTTFPPTEGTESTFFPTEGTTDSSTGETTTFPPTEGTTSTLSPTTTTISATETEITTSAPPESTTHGFICTSPGIFPDPYDCHSYYICNVHLHSSHYSCGEGSYFNPSTLECQEGDECPALPTQTSGIVSTTDETSTHAPFHCDAPGIYPDCYDCHAFYRCTVTGHMYHEYCPSGSHFDNLYAGCVDGEDCPDVICN